MTLYPHLSSIASALESLGIPVYQYASVEGIVIQNAPAIYLIPEDTIVNESITDFETIKAIRFTQNWLVLIMLNDAGDQNVTNILLEQLGEWQAKIIHVLCKKVLTMGGPITLVSAPKPMVYKGGAVMGQLNLTSQFVFTAE